MAFEVVKNIVDAEKEVENIKLQAQADGVKIKTQAQEEAEKMIADVKNNAKFVQQEMIEKALKNSASEVERIIAEARKQCEIIKSSSETKKEAAIKAVIGKVVGIDGDS